MKKTIILIAGPTAVGKTALSVALAQHYNTEIISADSRQCFKEITIGVAKPSANELQLVKHHFINSHSIHDDVTAATYETFALHAAEQIFQSHDTAIMVGGTGLYIKAFCEGMDHIPAIDESLRTSLQQLYNEHGMEWLQEQLTTADPLFAAKGEMQNPQRMLRALEVIKQTGQSIFSYQTGKKQQRDFHVIKIGLDVPREELYHRINLRAEQMINDGLLQEAASVYPFRHLNALQTVGYRELFDFIDEKRSLDEAIEKIKQNTRHYAKRQLTWFRRDEKIKWFHPGAFDEVVQHIQTEIKKADQS